MTVLVDALTVLVDITLAIVSAVVIVGLVTLLTVVLYDRGIGDLVEKHEREWERQHRTK